MCTDAPRGVCELALAYVSSDRVEAAYRRTDLFDRHRRVLMNDWVRPSPDRLRYHRVRAVGAGTGAVRVPGWGDRIRVRPRAVRRVGFGRDGSSQHRHGR